ncbi:MAG TPA: nuclear transport factor 2 family protein [Steroidobacteraceae bacterium]|nr:nuclear transport factor 2 family protein [Steroidobacteraceae bacterium]
MTNQTNVSEDLARRLLDGLVHGAPDSVRALFSGPADIDDPFAGRQIDGGFERLVRNWGPAKLATIKSTTLDHLTVGAKGRFCGAEFTLILDKNGQKQHVNLVAVLELAGSKILKSRLYYRRARIDGVQHVRNRILDEPQNIEKFFPVLEKYQTALSAGDAEAQAATFAPDGRFDGHGEHRDLAKGLGMGIYEGREAIRTVLVQMFGIIDDSAGKARVGANLEKLNIFADERTAVLEFNIIDPNHPTNRVHAGVAAYEIDQQGLIKEARVYDEAW